MTDIITSSFHINITILKFVGFYDQEKQGILLKVWTFILYSSSVLFTSLLAVKLIVGENDDFDQWSRSLILLDSCISCCLKFIPFLVNGSQIKKCIQFFGNQQFAPNNEKERNILEDCIKVCRRNFKIYFTIVVIIELSWNLMPLFEKKQRLSADVWLPYDVTLTPVLFYAMYFYGFLVTFYFGITTTVIELLLAGLPYHATGQLKILKYNLRNLTRNITQNENGSKITLETVSKVLIECVLRHNNILNFIFEFETCFSWILLSQVAATTCGLCFCCIGLTSGAATIVTDFLIFIPCYIYLTCQLFFYCHYGAVLTEENMDLRDAIYMGPWYRYDVKIRKMLLIIMERSKVPLTLTAGKVVNLDYATFTSAVKTSYSLIAVLKNF